MLALVAVLFGGVRSWETSNANDVSLVGDHELVVTMLGELVRQLRIVFLDIEWEIGSVGNWLTSCDRDVFLFVAPYAPSNTFTKTTGWCVIFVVASSLSVPPMRISVRLSRNRS